MVMVLELSHSYRNGFERADEFHALSQISLRLPVDAPSHRNAALAMIVPAADLKIRLPEREQRQAARNIM